MRKQVTTREKAFLGIGILAAVGIFVYFIFWPMLQGKQSGSMSSLEEMQERLESVEKLAAIEPLLVDLEKRMKSQAGYGEMSFKRGIANSIIIKYLADAAARADIKNLEQLNAKLDTSRKTRTEARPGDQAILRSIRDQLYLYQAMDEIKRLDEVEAEGSESQEADLSDEDTDESRDDVILSKAEEKNSKNPPKSPLSKGGLEEVTPDEPAEVNQPVEAGLKPAPTSDMEPGRQEEQAAADAVTFPPIPRNIPGEVKRSLVKWIESHPRQTIGIVDIDGIVEQVGIEDEKESARIRKRLKDYGDRVREKKNETLRWLSKPGISQNAKTGRKMDEFSVKMIFKSKMDQLVKLLYDLQNSAKWLKIESMRIGIADRKQTILSVELTMTATTLYD